MSSALRRRLAALRNLTEQRGATPGEAAAAEAAIARIRARLRQAGEALESPEPDQPYVQPTRQRRGRRSREPLRKVCLAVGDIVDCCDHEGVFSRCRCGSDRGEILPGDGIAAAWLSCLRCKRARKLYAHHFEPGGRWRQS